MELHATPHSNDGQGQTLDKRLAESSEYNCFLAGSLHRGKQFVAFL